jgi:azurin
MKTTVALIAGLCISNFCALALPHSADAAPKKSGGATSLVIGVKGPNLEFNKKALTVTHGQQVKLTFDNNAPKDSGMQHDWVLTTPDKAQDVANAGMAAGPDKGYVPDSADVVAHTRLLQPGEKETITFTAPAKPGKYTYLCTFPGHYPMMQGTLTVK